MLESILSIQPRTASGVGKSRGEIIDEIADSILHKTPKPYDEIEINQKFPTAYEESMNTVLF